MKSKSLKPLKPSMRENKRYLLVRAGKGKTGKNLRENIEKAILSFVGELGLSKAGLSFVKTDISSNTAIISVNRQAVDAVRASLAVWPEKMKVERVSGTMKGLKKVEK